MTLTKYKKQNAYKFTYDEIHNINSNCFMYFKYFRLKYVFSLAIEGFIELDKIL